MVRIKRGDYLVEEHRSWIQYTAGPSKECVWYAVLRVTSITRDGRQVKKVVDPTGRGAPFALAAGARIWMVPAALFDGPALEAALSVRNGQPFDTLDDARAFIAPFKRPS